MRFNTEPFGKINEFRVLEINSSFEIKNFISAIILNLQILNLVIYY